MNRPVSEHFVHSMCSDTPSEERFEWLTRLAKHMFDVPIALVSLVDENRQWFKSCRGLNVSETARDISFSDGVVAIDHEKKLSIESLLRQADSLMYENKQILHNDADNE